MNKTLVIVTCFWMCAACVLIGQERQRFRIMEYNVENLFDTLHVAGKQDAEFTPQGSRHWTGMRYWAKLGKIARVIAAVGGETPPDLVALVEVENDSVLSHLTRRTKLRRLGYEYICTRSLDARGINVALLYQPFRFRLISSDTVRVLPTDKRLEMTRDVLHVTGELVTGDTLDVVICHFPSRRLGERAAKYRMEVAKRVRTFVDSVMAERQYPYLVMTGDFNSWYPEPCMKQGLRVDLPADSVGRRNIYILSEGMKASHGITGTYRFQGNWNQLDNYVVSGSLLKPWKNHTLCTEKVACRIADFPFLLKMNRAHTYYTPYRTYLGFYYQGGFSDHLPLVLDLYY